MQTYTVEWSLTGVEADSPEEAALICAAMIADPANVATCWRVTGDKTGESGVVDIEDKADPYWIDPWKKEG